LVTIEMEMIESKIWIYCEERQGKVAEVSLELLGKALELGRASGRKVAAVLVGSQLDLLTEMLSNFGADEIVAADHPLLSDYCNQTYVRVLAEAVHRSQPEIFLLGATAVGTDLAARLAARLRTGLSAHCVDLGISSEGELRAVVPGWGGGVLATIRCPHTKPQMATVMPGVFGMPTAGRSGGKVIPLDVDVKPEEITYRILEVEKEELPDSSLDRAEVVIAGGWGVGSREDWQRLEELASELKGAVGATRPPVDEGWAKGSQMIGQSGRTVHPKLYIGIAISGEMHHMVGIKDAAWMVAVNQDPAAPIFSQCDMGLVGDFREILPLVIRAIRSYRTDG
jgi:electron transfer flavoprotein alpha subunit